MNKAWLLILLLVGCVSAPAPIIETPERLLWAPKHAKAHVILIAGLGLDRDVWLISGLGASLSRLGYAIHAIDPAGITLEARAAALTTYVTQITDRLPVVLIGHGIGGTIAYLASRSPRVIGVVGIGAPLAFGGSSRAAKYVFAQGAGRTWEDWAKLGMPGPSTTDSVTSRLLTDGLPSRILDPVVATALRPMGDELQALNALDVGPIPRPHVALDAIRGPLPVLVLTSAGNGLWPSWHCDPAAHGLRRAGITRIHLNLANYHLRRYNHLDLLVHPDAMREVHPLVEAWVKQVLN